MTQTIYPHNLACPIDGLPLHQQEQQLSCLNHHHFDVARYGYVNLLPVQHKKSKQPGDNKEMVAARAQFLNAQHYQPISRTLERLMMALLCEVDRHYCVLDAGCGDGYYLHELAQHSRQMRISWIGIDISKFAVMAAAKRNAQLTWLVASNKQLPVLAHSVDVLMSVFGFPSADGFARALAPNGRVIVVEPGAQHLIELRELLYETVEHSEHKQPAWLSSGHFTRLSFEHLQYQTVPLTNGELVSLLKMTPHFYRAPTHRVEHVCGMSQVAVTVDVTFSIYKLNELVVESSNN